VNWQLSRRGEVLGFNSRQRIPNSDSSFEIPAPRERLEWIVTGGGQENRSKLSNIFNAPFTALKSGNRPTVENSLPRTGIKTANV